jgi:hypothetical protein
VLWAVRIIVQVTDLNDLELSLIVSKGKRGVELRDQLKCYLLLYGSGCYK